MSAGENQLVLRPWLVTWQSAHPQPDGRASPARSFKPIKVWKCITTHSSTVSHSALLLFTLHSFTLSYRLVCSISSLSSCQSHLPLYLSISLCYRRKYPLVSRTTENSISPCQWWKITKDICKYCTKVQIWGTWLENYCIFFTCHFYTNAPLNFREITPHLLVAVFHIYKIFGHKTCTSRAERSRGIIGLENCGNYFENR